MALDQSVSDRGPYSFVSLLRVDRERVLTLTATRIGIGSRVSVGSVKQRNVVDLTRSGCVPVGSSPTPGSTANRLRTKIDVVSAAIHGEVVGLLPVLSILLAVRNDLARRATARTLRLEVTAPRSREVRAAPTARTIDQRLLYLRVQRRTSMETLMVRQDLSRVVARPVSISRRAPLPVEGQVVHRRIGSEVDARLPAAGQRRVDR